MWFLTLYDTLLSTHSSVSCKQVHLRLFNTSKCSEACGDSDMQFDKLVAVILHHLLATAKHQKCLGWSARFGLRGKCCKFDFWSDYPFKRPMKKNCHDYRGASLALCSVLEASSPHGAPPHPRCLGYWWSLQSSRSYCLSGQRSEGTTPAKRIKCVIYIQTKVNVRLLYINNRKHLHCTNS